MNWLAVAKLFSQFLVAIGEWLGWRRGIEAGRTEAKLEASEYAREVESEMAHEVAKSRSHERTVSSLRDGSF